MPLAVRGDTRRDGDPDHKAGHRRLIADGAPRVAAVRAPQPASPNSRAINMRCTSLVPSPISRIFESRHMRATGYSFMKP